MIPTGTLEDGGTTIVLSRRFPAPIEDVWASITESERLGRWFGTWTGDPVEGFVTLTMTAEAEGTPPSRFDIHECEPPTRLAVSTTDDFGSWHLVVDVATVDGGTELVLRQLKVEPGTAHEVGPGWEWYLDRLVAAVAGDEPPSNEAFEADYLPLGEHYRALDPTSS